MSLKKLQEVSGATPDGHFGPNTFKTTGAYLGITSHARCVHFFAQTGHETGDFKRFSENLNYSATALRQVFRKYFPTDEVAQEYERKPERIANRVYADRMGNGAEASGDGWKYRGRGALQLTGKNNYQTFSESINEPKVLSDPDLVAERYAFESAVFFFDENNLWPICDEGLDRGTIEKLTRRINGGLNGIEHRVELTETYSKYDF
ncbi:MAG: glycoside hydrolase family 19 protein [Bacteroidota bacterium]